MDKNKQIQKIEKLSIEKLSKDSSLAKRGLHDLGIWSSVKVLLEEIAKNYTEQKYIESLILCEELLQIEPSSYSGLTFKGLCLVRLQNFKEAISAICFS